jgi:hypothetical protein
MQNEGTSNGLDMRDMWGEYKYRWGFGEESRRKKTT